MAIRLLLGFTAAGGVRTALTGASSRRIENHPCRCQQNGWKQRSEYDSQTMHWTFDAIINQLFNQTSGFRALQNSRPGSTRQVPSACARLAPVLS